MCRDSQIRSTPLVDQLSRAPRETKSPVFRKFSGKMLVVSTIKLFCFVTHIHKLFFSNLPQMRITA